MTPLRKSVRRVTVGALDGSFGCDRGRRLVVSLEPGDLVSIRPAGTRRPETVSAFDLYRWAIRCRVNSLRLERAREAKNRKREARERARLHRSIRNSR